MERRVRIGENWKKAGNEFGSLIKVGMTGEVIGYTHRYVEVRLDNNPYLNMDRVLMLENELEDI